MKSANRVILVAIFSVILFSCVSTRNPVATSLPDNNKSYKVDYLFEHEGCKVYRFWDMGNYVYFTNCVGEVTSIANDSTSTRVTNIVRKNPIP